MNPLIRSRRILSRLTPYHEFSDIEKGQYNIELEKDEYLIGIYKNNFTENIDNIIITNKALVHLSKENYDKIYFGDILKVNGPKNKIDDFFLILDLKNGAIWKLPIMGTSREGKCKDIFEFVRFMFRVLEDLKNEKFNKE